MPIFSSTSHVQINGGNFLEIEKDFNLQSIQPPEIINEAMMGLELGVEPDSSRELSSAERTEREGGMRMCHDLSQDWGRHLVGAERTVERDGGVRMRPYDIVHRREILPPENNSHATGLTSLPSYGLPIQIGELEFPNSSTINGLGTNTVLRQSDHGLGVHFPQFPSDSHYFDQAGLSSSSRSPVESGDANSEYRATDFPRGPSHLSTYPLTGGM
ncbi:hypothetical protein B0H13DRAFT_2264179 [Mycena leptocephala]|nr:hypothetical protein B0H13DRAFT_2264179 [Mycena leptocephala]